MLVLTVGGQMAVHRVFVRLVHTTLNRLFSAKSRPLRRQLKPVPIVRKLLRNDSLRRLGRLLPLRELPVLVIGLQQHDIAIDRVQRILVDHHFHLSVSLNYRR